MSRIRSPVGDQQLDRRRGPARSPPRARSPPISASKVRATAAVFAANDTAGTLLTFRGWALHDRTTLAFNRSRCRPSMPKSASIRRPSPIRCSTSGSGFAHRPGYYAKLAWQPPIRSASSCSATTIAPTRRHERRPRMGLADASSTTPALVADLGGGAPAQGGQALRAARTWATPMEEAGAGSIVGVEALVVV